MSTKTQPSRAEPVLRASTRETRAKLISAAADLFGRLGFEATGTRAVADAAGVNIAAIKYHFGGKEGLYAAVAEHIAGQISGTIVPIIGEAQARPGALTADAAREILLAILLSFNHLMVANPETENWARFIMREQMAPSAAFDILYERVMGRGHGFMTHLVATITGEPPESPAARLTAFAMIGQVLIFRVARAAVLRRMDWRTIGRAEEAQISDALRKTVARLGANPPAKVKGGQ
jgi:TetR/AcrR family transcriptional regulator, regulator of cefoperazone and chloramphenicol sensitivity